MLLLTVMSGCMAPPTLSMKPAGWCCGSQFPIDDLNLKPLQPHERYVTIAILFEESIRTRQPASLYRRKSVAYVPFYVDELVIYSAPAGLPRCRRTKHHAKERPPALTSAQRQPGCVGRIHPRGVHAADINALAVVFASTTGTTRRHHADRNQLDLPLPAPAPT
jgi:hypothetical protein